MVLLRGSPLMTQVQPWQMRTMVPGSSRSTLDSGRGDPESSEILPQTFHKQDSAVDAGWTEVQTVLTLSLL